MRTALMRTIAAIALTVLVSGIALGQPADGKPAFDIADVHFSPRADWAKTVDNWSDGGFLGGDRYQIRRATMLDLIRNAWNVDPGKISGGPSWIDYDRYEVIAKTKPGTPPATVRLMLQNLLADRFHLIVKTDNQLVPGLILQRADSKLKITPADPKGPSGCHDIGVMRTVDIQCHNMTMDEFAAFLHSPSSPPVLNDTGLDGGWDFELQYTLGNLAVGSEGSRDEALEKLGLHLEPGKVSQPVLTVVSVNEEPSANPPGLTEALPPLPDPEFEVASVRLCDPNNNFGSGGLGFQPGGRVTATCQLPIVMIWQAWHVTRDDVVGVPKSFEGGRDSAITIVARAPANVVPPDRVNARDFMNAMIRSLLIDRYKMKIHFEDRPKDAYTLVAVKPKLTKADPSNRTACTSHIQAFPGQGSVHELVCRNMTMAQFAEQAQAYSGNRYPVIDDTHIEGAWDFTINYGTLHDPSQAAIAQGLIPEPVDPGNYFTFNQAIEKQLGLKLEVHKRPEPVLVIDSMNDKPAEN